MENKNAIETNQQTLIKNDRKVGIVMKMRSSNIELLRVIAMIMIVAHHLVAHGIFDELYNPSLELFLQGSNGNRLFACFLEPGGEIGVAIFFLITGYFMVDKVNVDTRRLIKIISQVIFYAICIYLFFIVTYLSGIAKFEYLWIDGKIPLGTHFYLLIDHIFSFTTGRWWFATSYILLCVISPILNTIINKLTKNGLALLLLAWFVGVMMINCIGYSFTQIDKAIMFYTMGAYCRKWVSRQDKFFYVGCWLVFAAGWSGFTFLKYFEYLIVGDSTKVALMTLMFSISKSVLCTTLASTSIFLIFSKYHKGIISQTINNVAGATFGVYLIHDSELLRMWIWEDILHIKELYLTKWFIATSIIIIAVLFGGCTMIELCRKKYVEELYLKYVSKILKKIENRYCDKANENG